MTSLAILDRLPAEYVIEQTARGVLAAHTDVAESLSAAGYGPEADGHLEPSDLMGRRPLMTVRTPGLELAVRRFRHGGLLRWISRDRFFDPERPFRELLLSHDLRCAGVRTPPVLAARARVVRGGGWQLDVITPRIEKTIDLGAFLERLRRGLIAFPVRRAVIAAAGRAIRGLHESQCLHADLHPKNLLVSEAALSGADPEIWILDLDRSRLGKPVGESERRENLRRLFRYVARRDERLGGSITRADVRTFFNGYDAGSHGEDGYDARGDDWREDWRVIQRQHQKSRSLHGLGWALEGMFGQVAET